MQPVDLTPPNSGEFAKALSIATDFLPLVEDGVKAMRTAKLVSPPPSWLPFLVYEYGLGELSPYVPNLYDLIDEGIRWQRVRGTPLAVEKGLGFVGYAGELIEAPVRRAFWNLFDIRLDRLRDNERPDLSGIDGVTRLSVPLRSYFWRGFHGYDVQPLELGWSKLGDTLLGDDSGVRIDSVKAKWSFGRLFEFSKALSEQELTQLGVWQADIGGGLAWGNYSWNDAQAAWSDPAAATRTRLMLTGLTNRSVWFEFKDQSGDVIGYRKARFNRAVRPQFEGEYEFDGSPYTIDLNAPTTLLVEANTDFGEGDGQTAVSVGLIFDANPTDPKKPGLLWAEPNELTNLSAAVAVQAILIDFSRTVRERVRFRLSV